MYKKEITYEGYDGIERKRTFYFNLSQADITKMQMGEEGGLDAKLKKIIDSKDIPSIMKEFDAMIDASYGVISDDGERFVKSPELTKAFKETKAYSQFFMDLCTKDGLAAEFFNSVVPAEVANAMNENK